MNDKIKNIIDQLNKHRNKLEDDNKCGPIPYIDEAVENLERALEELEVY